MIDCHIFLMDNMGVNEVVAENEDGTYSIFINERLCEQKQINSYYHAINHIVERDFEKEDVQEIEKDAHK